MSPTLNRVPALAHKMTNRLQIYIWERSEATLDGRVHWGLKKLVLKFLERVLNCLHRQGHSKGQQSWES